MKTKQTIKNKITMWILIFFNGIMVGGFGSFCIDTFNQFDTLSSSSLIEIILKIHLAIIFSLVLLLLFVASSNSVLSTFPEINKRREEKK